MKLSVATFTILTLSLLIATAADKPSPVVVELFTSQGCSSCPPAEKLLSVIGKKPGVIALAYHVTYWDRLGWKDPFSLQSATDRQSDYAQLFKVDEVYTPQVIVNGKIEFVGSREDRMTHEIQQAQTTVKLMPLGLSIDSSGSGQIDITVTIDAKPAKKSDHTGIVLALRESGLETSIPRGENAGLKMINDYVVLDFVDSEISEKSVYPLKTQLRLHLPASIKKSQLQLVALLQSLVDGSILNAGTLNL